MTADTLPNDSPPAGARSAARLQRWGALACFVLAAAFLLPPLIYLTGNLRQAFGRYAYAGADFLSGPLWAALLVLVVTALRERIGALAGRRMSLALPAAFAAAALFTALACIRAANRQYHLAHPELRLEESVPVLVVWTTLAAGLTGAGFHFLGWVWVLVGWAGWTSRRLPLPLSALLLAAGAAALFVYVQPVLEGAAVLLSAPACAWLGLVLWRGAGRAPG